MAGPGTYGAYQQLTPTRADFGDPMERFADRTIATQDKNRAYQDQQRREKMAMGMELDKELQALDPVITGMQSIDEINYAAFSDATQQLGDIHRQIMENPQAANDPALRMKRANLLNSSKVLAAFQKRTTETYEMLTKGMADTSLSKANMALLNEMQSYYGVKQQDGSYTPNFVIKYDEKGLPYTVVKTADGRMVRRSVASVINGYDYDPGDLIKTADPDKYINDFKAQTTRSLGPAAGGMGIYETFDRDAAAGVVRSSLVSDGEPTSMAKSIWVDKFNRDLSELTMDGVNQIQNYLLDGIQSKVQTGIASYSRAPQGNTAASQKLHSPNRLVPQADGGKPVMSADGKAAFTYRGGLQINPTKKDEFFDEILIGADGKIKLVGQDKTKIKDLPPGATPQEVADIENLTLEDLFRDTEDGVVTYYRVDKVETSDIRDINKAANVIGLRDADELRAYLEGQATSRFGEGAIGSTPPPTPTKAKGSSGATYE